MLLRLLDDLPVPVFFFLRKDSPTAPLAVSLLRAGEKEPPRAPAAMGFEAVLLGVRPEPGKEGGGGNKGRRGGRKYDGARLRQSPCKY
jgi:hypothetical protein